ncbi:hypothetical protein [Dehalogenimonas sp. 4OHTPN]|uniref:CD-NTase-associated protein 15 domain-containing protein n=1 Tax=Dehalogenimonas sp. 4OHTPN TaxID=3166643 RepID=A0AAU8GAQ4_9CHLR
MHAYSHNHGERVRVILVIAFLSLILVWALHWVLLQTSVSIPWWFGTPSVLGTFAIFQTVFDRSLWKNQLIRHLLSISVPTLQGRWKGKIVSSDSGHSNPIDAYLTIAQTWTQMALSIETSTSISRTRMAAFLPDEPSGLSLVYEYLCEPKPHAMTTMHIHHGTGKLHFSLNQVDLEGSYYTGRDRLTFGSFSFSRI